MITEDYVNFETAKLLKEKGFDEECFALYNPDGILIQSGIRLNNIQVGRVKGSYSAPTLQMVMKWLREVHKIYIDINIHIILEQWAGYDINIYATNTKDCLLDKVISYKEACEAAIRYCLGNLINKKESST